MSRTLNLIDVLLNSGRHLADIGRTQEAIDTLTRLADFRKLPRQVLEEIQSLLADLHMRQEDYTKARRHLTAALAARPLHAEYHYMMAIAIEEDDQADLKRAEMYYARATELDGDKPHYWVDYGAYLLRAGNRTPGLKAIRKAYALGNEDAEIVGQVVEELRLADRFDEARTKLRAILFRNHGDHRFRELWQQHQFLTVCHEQEKKSQACRRTKRSPMLLPFVAAASTGKYVELGRKTIRIDEAQPLKEPKAPGRLPFQSPPKG